MSRSTALISGRFRLARRRLVVVIVCLVCLVSVCIAWMLLAHGQDNDVGRVRVLPDGSKLRLEQVLFRSRSFSYSFVEGGKPVYWILSKLPVGLRKKLKVPGGGVAYGGPIPGNTNLLIVTVQRQPGGPGALKSLSEVGRLRVCPDRWVNILRMTDDHGRQLNLTGGLSNLSPLKRLFFKPEAGVASVTLTLAVPTDRVVEFMARPQLVDDMKAVAIE